VELVDAEGFPVWIGVAKADQAADVDALATSVGVPGAVGLGRWLPTITLSKRLCERLVAARRRQVETWCNYRAKR
jgi:hypothetical protein